MTLKAIRWSKSRSDVQHNKENLLQNADQPCQWDLANQEEEGEKPSLATHKDFQMIFKQKNAHSQMPRSTNNFGPNHFKRWNSA